MKLIWFIYQNYNRKLRRKKVRRKYILAILLGERYGKYDVLVSNFISDGEGTLIRALIKELKLMNVVDRITWFRKHLPSMFRKAYRTIHKDHVQILDEMDIKPL